MRKLSLAAFAATLLLAVPSFAQEEAPPPPKESWSFYGIFGTYDRAAAQRGFQIYNEVCANCHSLNLLTYGDLKDLGFTGAQVTAIAGSKQVPTINDQGEAVQRPALPSDHFVAPFANEKAARAANNGALPPDLSLIIKAREGGPDYVHAILKGYGSAPADFKLGDGMNYNEYFPGHQIAMPQPLSDNSVSFADGAPSNLDAEATDIVTFLAWAAEPRLEERHRTGLKAILFLLAMTGVLYGAKRRIWSDVEH